MIAGIHKAAGSVSGVDGVGSSVILVGRTVRPTPNEEVTMYKCNDCDNADKFLTERRVWVWVMVDGEDQYIGDPAMQGDPDCPTGVEDPVEFAHMECAHCGSSNLEWKEVNE